MQIRKSILFTLLILCGHLNASFGYNIAYTNQEYLHEIGKGVKYLVDPEKNVVVEDLISNKLEMKAYPGNVLNFMNINHDVWIKFDVINTTGEKLYLQFGNSELDNIVCYGVQNQQIVWKKESGNLHPYHSRYLRSSRVSLPIEDQNITVYLKLNTRASFYLPLYVGTLKALSRINHLDDLFNGAVLGIMLVMMLYNLILFLFVRDLLYFQYCLYLALSTLMMLFIEGLQFDLLWPGNYTINRFYLTNIIVALTTGAAIWFSATFLQVAKNAPKVKWINRILLLALGICILMEVFFQQLILNSIIQAVSGITSVYLFTLGMLLFFKGLKAARYYFLAWGFLVSGAVIYILTLNGVININFFTLNSFQIASMMESVLLSFALADRINAYRLEKNLAQKLAIKEAKKNEQLIRDQNFILEREVKIRTHELNREMRKSEDLLLHILPHEIAEELKEHGESQAQLHEHVTVLFTDFVNFTQIAEKLSPMELVNALNHYFKIFDQITDKYGLEKIKTIGDAYLAVCGLPHADPKHAIHAIQAALEINNFIEEEQLRGGIFKVRMGINSGPVIAGIVGNKKFAYDIWGDTVNIAARMESSSKEGRVNISQSTYELVKSEPSLVFENRGKIEAKGKGLMDMWFVDWKVEVDKA